MQQTAKALILGMDIGTTTISAAVADPRRGRQLTSATIPNASGVSCPEESWHEQDPERIVSDAIRLAETLLEKHPGIGAIGITGQMHGIVYIDAEGRAVSNLITWQDCRAAERLPDGDSACERIYRQTGWNVPAGYGMASHYFNQLAGLVPEKAESFCTIMDYLAMRMTGRKTPIVHASNAAGFGLFDNVRCAFDPKAAEKLGIAMRTLPEVSAKSLCIGEFRKIPVAIAIGDNQASFIGAVREEEEGLLVNFGTGSQISFVAKEGNCGDSLELRPFVGGRYLLSGSALCGGRAYALLERFFREYAEAAGFSVDSHYAVLNRLAEEARREKTFLPVQTTFCGTRKDPDLRGSILEIGEENFTPGQMARGFLTGMVREVYDLYVSGGHHGGKVLIASGNAVQKNPVLQELLAEIFRMKLQIPLVREEAALGAAVFAGVCSGLCSVKEGKSCIHYQGEEE